MPFAIRKRLRMKPERKRLEPMLDIIQPRRSSDYVRLRAFWLSEMYWLRAKKRAGTGTVKDIKVAQRELARVRKLG